MECLQQCLHRFIRVVVINFSIQTFIAKLTHFHMRQYQGSMPDARQHYHKIERLALHFDAGIRVQA